VPVCKNNCMLLQSFCHFHLICASHIMTPHCVSITEQTTAKSCLLLNIVYMHSLYKKLFYSKDDQEIENALSNELSYVNQCRFYLVGY
jgi:hypothetical protein